MVTTKGGQTELYEEVYAANIGEDEDHILRIASIVNTSMTDKFSISFTDPKSKGVELKLIPSLFVVIYDTILETLKDMTKSYSAFNIDIGGRFIIGFSTKESEDDEDNEKIGNIVIRMVHSNNRSDVGDVDKSLDASERCVQWNAENIRENPEIVKKITIKAKENIAKRLNVQIHNEQMIMPIFCTIYDMTFEYLKKYMNVNGIDEMVLNFINCFKIIAQVTEDGEFIFGLEPNFTRKQALKDDFGVSSSYE
jgi:hypothetical protein